MVEIVSFPNIAADLEVEAPPYTPASGDWNIMKETDPAIIELQIKEGVKVFGSPADFLNNFVDSLPGGRRRSGQYAQLAEKLPDRFGPDAKRQKSEEWEPGGWQERVHSDRMRLVTNAEFHKDIEDAIAEVEQDPDLGITRDTIEKLNTARTDGKLAGNREGYVQLLSDPAQKVYKQFGENIDEAFAQYLLPVYARLRAMGYSHYDLFQ